MALQSSLKTICLLLYGLFVVTSVFAATDTAYGSEIVTDTYTVSRDIVSRTILYNSFFDDFITIENHGLSTLTVDVVVSTEVRPLIIFNRSTIVVPPGEQTLTSFRIMGLSYGTYTGEIVLQGGVSETIPVTITVAPDIVDPLYLIDTRFETTSFHNLEMLSFVLSIDSLQQGTSAPVNVSYTLIDHNNVSYDVGSDFFNESTMSRKLSKQFVFPANMSFGDVHLITRATFGSETITINSYFVLEQHFLTRKLLGFLPMWMLLVIVFGIFVLLFIIYMIRRRIRLKKKYRMELIPSTLPKPNKEYLMLGRVAETKIPAYLEPERMKTHTIVAGATGGGKSISAQVIVEEVLKQNIAVIVFDPTAQWSGMLRKCEDQKMFNYYPKFKMKKTDAMAFPGSIRMVTDAREIIDVSKHIAPGQIQIFALNKLDPKDMDIFVANVIREIFKSDPKEAPELKLLLVFDEVHRLLAKFGGSGEGFLQIERACREFRKWGMGVMLVSQVLNDFVGEIKANINTEVQMRTRDEGDLGRIDTKYGSEFLQSLVKASVGVGMFVNQNYNKGKPYFIQFRPILHNTRRLTDEELEQYNGYNEQADQISFEIEELEKLKVDVFDLKMELKLVKDKIMTGNFSVVDIYLQGLKPRLEKQWQKLGKTAPKMQKKLANLDEIRKSIEEAKKARAKYEAEHAKKGESKEAASAPVAADPVKKIVSALTFDNGMMVASLDELMSVLPDIDADVFMSAQKKNAFVTFAKAIDPTLAQSLTGKVQKAEIVAAFQAFIDAQKKASAPAVAQDSAPKTADTAPDTES